MKAIKLKELKKGEFFTLKPVEEATENQVFVRGDLDRSDRKYYCSKFSDFCAERAFKGDKIVYTDFIF